MAEDICLFAKIMPTVIIFEYNGEWEIKEDDIFKWRQWSNCKWAAIPLDCEICSMQYIQSEIYRIMNLVGTEKLKLSYLPDVKHCNIRPMYIEDDNDLKAYLYFGCAKERPVLYVEYELNIVSLDVVETNTSLDVVETNTSIDIVETDCIISTDVNVTDLNDDPVDCENIEDNEKDLYDHYFDRTFVENSVLSMENGMKDIDAVHVDDNNVIQQTHIEHITPVHNTEIHVQASNDTYSFTDGSNLFIGQRFSSKIEVKKELSKIALSSSFEFESVKSSRNVYSVRCVTKGCSWRIWTSKHEDSTDFVIRTYCNTHNCDLTGMRKRHRQASSSVVCDMLVDNFRGQQKTPQPKSIMTMMRNKGVEITYYKALKGKQLAYDVFRGDPEKSFALLPSYLKMVKTMNPGSIIDLVVDDHNRFKYLFLAYGACARGYRCMRKVVSIDGTWLKGKYNGTLLVASSQDGDFHQYPLAWAVVDVESIASWSWFLTKLLEIVVDEEELMIISDRHSGIIAAVADVYRNAHHGHCIWHLSQNMKIRCKKKGCVEMFMRLAKIYKQTEFDVEYEKFKKIYPDGAKFLDESDSLDRWTRAYSPRSRYNIMTTNGVESINARLREERQLPIIALLDSLQGLTTSWFSRYRNASVVSTTNFTPSVESILRERFNDARGYQVYELGRLEFEVRSATNSAIVDLESKRCTCRVFDIDKIPCSHAIAASYLCDVNFYSLCSEYYSVVIWSLAYSEPVYPVLDQNEWPHDDTLVLPPEIKRRRGRKKQNRFPSIGEFGRRSS